MKGIVFTEFLDFVEETAGYEIVDQMILNADVPSGGVYTAVGKYDFKELADLIGELSKLVRTPGPQLIRMFGRHMFARFHHLYPVFFVEPKSTLEFLESVETKIHKEVQKLYPDAELPRIKVSSPAPDQIDIHYQSCRPLGELCLGLIEGCATFYGEDFDMEKHSVDGGLSLTLWQRAETRSLSA